MLNIKFRAIDKSTNNIISSKRSISNIIRDEIMGRNKTYIIQMCIDNNKTFEEVKYKN